MYCDCNLYLLPGFSNGPTDIYSAVDLFLEVRESGVSSAIITPAFDFSIDTVSSFLLKRKIQFNNLVQAIKLTQYKDFEFILSAEVNLSEGLSSVKDLHKLCLGKSNYLPITLPLDKIGRHEMAELVKLIHKKNIYPIICHMERYCIFYSKDQLKQLLSIPHAVYHFGAKSMYDNSIFEYAIALMRINKNVIIGTCANNALSFKTSCNIPRMMFESKVGLAPYNVLALKNNHFLKLCIEGKQHLFD